MKHLHFIGIGGARLRGLAKLYYDRGYEISGSDMHQTRETEDLVKRGIKVMIGHNPEQITGADLVVYTNAVGEDNPELIAAKKQGIPVLEGAELLGQLMSEVGTGIAIAGTHGKTTTTAMTAQVLTEGGLDPTVFIGGELSIFNGNHRTGNSQYMVVEACEFRNSFLKLNPTIELITNVDWDHPDCFPTFADVIKTFQDFVQLLPPDGLLVVWGDDPKAAELKKSLTSQKCITFGYQEDFDWSVSEIKAVEPLGISARLKYRGRDQGELVLRVPGKHNLQNALGALALATELGVELNTVLKSLASFTGVRKRFEIKGDYQGTLVVDDYAHHPAAIKVTLAAAKEFFKGKGRIWCAFQPHLYSRTKHLLQEFAQAFQDADVLLLADIFPARETDPGDISSGDLAREASKYHHDVRYLGDFDRIYELLKTQLQPGDLLITMGAGNIWTVGERLLK
ncbi:MAG TPA: UDP-N-acetylmuramate--L-alanine ligase [Bacillota bacterium]|jgi:UDP-N-acetylmuramate--alanine ligase|nr:UDP-N-acetylmuramate--L-alanine ligase [Bacillota bacterium]HOL09439.1 UDP-N-acetylmuramate--L-alanine ligase [Bacillota bacterium]HPO98587.1 UDP-N-acetylmuramate--L-alanine ligase [Bacillota bacterium]